MERKKKFKYFIGALLIFVVLGISILLIKDNLKIKDTDIEENARLTVAEIEALRTEYPLVDSWSMIEYADLDLDEIIERAPAFIEVEVIKILPNYTVDFSYNLSEKSLDSTLEFMQYELNIIDILASNESFNKKPGDTIVLSVGVERDVFPALKDGMKFIVPVEASSGPHEGKYSIYIDTFYYVTSDDYIISAFEETNDKFNYTGVNKSEFKKESEKMNNNTK